MRVLLVISVCVIMAAALPVFAADDPVAACAGVKGSPVAPTFRRLCENLISDHQRGHARRSGQPSGSREIVELPAYGTERGRQLGLVCMSGQAMRRLPNGWEQLVDASGSWVRCRNSGV